MTIHVQIEGSNIPIRRDVFVLLLDNSVAGTYVDYEKAKESGVIKFPALIRLARIGEIPYPLFFAQASYVEAQVAAKTEKLLAGVNKKTFSIGSRERVELRDVELILKDLMRKQELLKRHDSSLTKNRVVGLLRKPGASVEVDASTILNEIGLRHADMWACRTKERALELIIERLESNQVFVSRSVQHYMPQRLTHVDFSGITIRDNKVPYIFLAGGDHGDHQEPVGRTIFTLALMAVLIARRIFSAVTWDAESMATNLGREYDVAGAMLMPASAMESFNFASRAEVVAAADRFKVTPSAVVVRALRLGLLGPDIAGTYLDKLREEFERRPKLSGMNQIRPENAVRKYAGRQLTQRMIKALDAGSVTRSEFYRTVCLNKIRDGQLEDLRRALR